MDNRDKSLFQKMLSLCFLCCLVYFASYLTRKSYNASILAIIQNTTLTKTQTGLAVTGSFITYGLGQVINGFLGDRIRPRFMICTGLLGASICNIFIPFLATPAGLLVLWCFNGFFQSMIWPPLVRSMSENFTLEFYKKASMWVNIASSVATVAIYAIVSFFVEYFEWQTTFYFTALLGVAASVLWFVTYKKYEHYPLVDRYEDASADSDQHAERLPFLKVVFMSSAIPIAIVIVLMGFLRDGIETWMSYFLNDAYSVDTSGAILSVAILPVLSVLSFYVGSFLQKKTGCPVSANIILWFLCILCSVALVLFYKDSAALGITSIALLSGGSHAINLMLISRAVIYYKKVGYVSTFSGILNAFTYIGAAVATYGIADITEKYSWTAIMVLFLGVCIVGFVVSIIALPQWKKFMKY